MDSSGFSNNCELLYVFFWVIPRRLDFTCRRFGTLCLFNLYRRIGVKELDWTGVDKVCAFSVPNCTQPRGKIRKIRAKFNFSPYVKCCFPSIDFHKTLPQPIFTKLSLDLFLQYSPSTDFHETLPQLIFTKLSINQFSQNSPSTDFHKTLSQPIFTKLSLNRFSQNSPSTDFRKNSPSTDFHKTLPQPIFTKLFLNRFSQNT